MRQAGLSVMALAGLMIVGAPIAQAGVTCKVVPSWCPGSGDSPGSSNKGAGGSVRVASNGHTGHDTGNSGGAGNTGNAGSAGNEGNAGNAGNTGNTGNTGNGGNGGNGGTNTTGGGTSNGGNANTGTNNGGTGNGGSQGNSGNGTGGAGTAAPTAVPEPASLLLLGAGVSAAGAAVFRRRKNKKD